MQKHIKVYSKENCPECVKVKQFLKNHDIVYEEIAINSDNIEMLMKHSRSAPVVFVDGVFKNNEQVYLMNKDNDVDLDIEM